MHKHGGHKRKTVFSEINITPLTDIFLVLLTIMMIVAPFMRQVRTDIKLPDVASGAEVQKDVVSVDVTQDGKYFIDTVEVPLERLTDVLKQKGERFIEKKLLVQADKDVKSGAVLGVFRAAEEAQYARMTVVGHAANSTGERKPDETGAPGSF
jgi:biopolymer transport protein ExbD/biopolymer transport protein TolR